MIGQEPLFDDRLIDWGDEAVAYRSIPSSITMSASVSTTAGVVVFPAPG
jgi:hypothetical protein